MTHSLGELLLIMGLVFSLIQIFVPLYGYYTQKLTFQAYARPAAHGQFIFILLAFCLLLFAFFNNDFSILYVAAHSHQTLPFFYRLSALWGGHEGSVLLWVFMLSLFTQLYAFTANKNKHPTFFLTLAILGILSASFISFILLTSDPFLLNLAKQAPVDLNPLLQDSGLMIHPPILYAGYVGFSIPFAITLAALIHGHLDKTWSKLTQQFNLLAFCFLTLGITLGSWWAYRVLGWGGFWFWDPVENASLLPWLSSVALIHILALHQKRQIAARFAACLALITFSLSLLGTFLVRSGILISAHTFATDPSRGFFLLGLLSLLLLIAFSIFIYHSTKTLSLTKKTFTFFSRETGLLLNSVLLLVAMTTILLGTLYPLIIETFGLMPISVGAPYFNTVLTPLAFFMMLMMAIIPLFSWQKHELNKKLLLSIIFISLISVLLIYFYQDGLDILSGLFLFAAFFLFCHLTQYFQKKKAMAISHFGFGLMILGIILSSFLPIEREVRIKPGEIITVGAYQFLFTATSQKKQSNFMSIRAQFDVIKNNKHIATLFPEKRLYLTQPVVMSHVAIDASIWRDLYIALGEPLTHNAWSVRIYYKPFIRLIWLGGILMMLGALLTITNRNDYSKRGHP